MRTSSDGYVEFEEDGRMMHMSLGAYAEYMDYRGRYVNLDGKPVDKTPQAWPYNYDEYVVWKGNYHKEKARREYSDRMASWDNEKWKKAWARVSSDEGIYAANSNPSKVREVLKYYYGKEVNLTAILQGCNQASGFPYWVYVIED